MYNFTVAGSSTDSFSGARVAGYIFTAQIVLIQGETLQIVVGQTPPYQGFFDAGGGGATFVLSSNGQSALFIAGGAGGNGGPALGLSASPPAVGAGGAGDNGAENGFSGLLGQGGAGGNGQGGLNNGNGGGGGGGTLGEAFVSWSFDQPSVISPFSHVNTLESRISTNRPCKTTGAPGASYLGGAGGPGEYSGQDGGFGCGGGSGGSYTFAGSGGGGGLVGGNGGASQGDLVGKGGSSFAATSAMVVADKGAVNNGQGSVTVSYA